jgi:cobalt-zinc-cadmium efflux system outer membrane protein
MYRSILRAYCLACCLIASTVVCAADAPNLPLTLKSAIERGLALHPDLAGFAFELRAQDARISEAQLSPQPEVDFLLEDAGGSGVRRGVDTAQTTLSLSQVIELSSKREGRKAVATATRSHLETEHAARQLDVIAEIARRFIQTLEQQAQLDLAREGLAISERMHGAVEQRVRAAKSPEAELARADAAFARAQLDVEDAQHQLEASRRWLAAAMGEKQVRFGPATGDLLALSPVQSFDVLIEKLQSTPDFLSFANEARLRDAEIRLAEMRRRPDVRASFGVRRFEDQGDYALVAGVNVPLFSGSRARSQIDAAQAARLRVDTMRDAAYLRAQAQLFDVHQELGHALHEADTLRANVLPRLTEALRETEYAYERGRYSYLEWTDAQRELLATRRRLIETATEFHTFRIEIERLTGESIAPRGEEL